MKTKRTTPQKPNTNSPESGLQNRPEQPCSQTKQTSPDKPPAPANPEDPRDWSAVFFDGPQAEQDRDGEEIPVWHVYVGTQDAEPAGRVYRVFSFAKAQALAQAMCKDRRLVLLSEATPA